MVVTPSNRELGGASSSIARSNSNIPEARISARRPGIDDGSISVIASVFMKCPNAVKVKTRANPNRPAQRASPPEAVTTIQGTSNNAQMIASCFIFRAYPLVLGLNAGLHGKPPRLDGLLERLVVRFGLVCIRAGKLGEGTVGSITFA
jgi:hypothetical protein